MKKTKQKPPTLGDIERGVCSAEELAPYREGMQQVAAVIKQASEGLARKTNDALAPFQKNMEEMIQLVQRTMAHPDVNGLICLCNAIEEALSTPEVKKSAIATELGQKFLELMDIHPGIPQKVDSVFEPVTVAAIQAHDTETHRRAGSTPKKQEGKDKALGFWNEWASNPKKFRNKTAFCKYLIVDKCCDTDKTAGKWVEEFRTSNPSSALEKILPQKK